MQLCSATVMLSADRNFCVPKPELSVAEIILLQRIHGDGSVVDIKPLRKTPRPLRAERERLMAFYGEKPEIAAIITAMFADVAVQGLEKMSDLNLADDDDEDEDTEHTGPGAAKSAAITLGTGDLDAEAARKAKDAQRKAAARAAERAAGQSAAA